MGSPQEKHTPIQIHLRDTRTGLPLPTHTQSPLTHTYPFSVLLLRETVQHIHTAQEAAGGIIRGEKYTPPFPYISDETKHLPHPLTHDTHTHVHTSIQCHIKILNLGNLLVARLLPGGSDPQPASVRRVPSPSFTPKTDPPRRLAT